MSDKVLYAIGEALIDFIPDKNGCAFDSVTAFSPAVGGAPANVCGAFAKLGGKSAIITQLGNDPFGHKIERYLKKCGIDVSQIRFTDSANTALAFVSLSSDGNRTFSFYRNPSADMLYSPEMLDKSIFENAYALHFCSVSLADTPMKKAHSRAIEYARENGAIISFDPNLRFPLWSDKEELKRVVHKFIPMTDILKISDEELEFLCETRDIQKALPMIFKENVKLVLYTCGGGNSYAFTPSFSACSPAKRVQAVDTTGAGDGFIGSFLHSLYSDNVRCEDLCAINDLQLKKYLEFSNSFCAHSVTGKGAIDSYPTQKQLKGE